MVNELAGSFHLHQFRRGNLENIRELRTDKRGFQLAEPKQICYGETTGAVIAASDHGALYIIDRATGLMRSKLMGFAPKSTPVVTVSIFVCRLTIHSLSARRGPRVNITTS